VIGPDGRPQTETRTYSSGVEGGLGGFTKKIGGWIDDGARAVNTVAGELNKMGLGPEGGLFKVKAKPTEARYKRGWGGGSTRMDRYKPPQKLEAKNYKGIKAECLSKGILFEDPDFEAVDKSIFYSRTPPRPFEWKRPPEMCQNPQLFVGGASRFDVQQGELGDCWLLAAVACLCGDKKLLYRVVPPDQSFQNEYAGIFYFQFWRFGQWEDVIVDDRLPTYNGRLVFLHSAENNEFWTALLEKAYAKLMGSYEALKGGSTSEAMEDFTGGVTENFDLRENPPANLFQQMLKAHQRSSLMGCSIEAMPGKMEAELENGLIMGHAYSITSVKAVDIQTSRMKGKIPMVRIRNPWGNECEWKGAWSDKSPEWRFISEAERKEIGLTFSDDGEFWMAFSDFSKNFQKLEICHLGPSELDPGTKRWEATQLEGSWKKRINAGGCRNYLDTFWTNPQYQVEVVDADDDDDENGTLILGLMQKDRRKLRKEGLDMLTIGYAIYPVKPEVGNQPLDLRFFKYNASVAKSPSFINTREVCGRHKLKPGKYAVIPSTFEPNQDGDFILRVFSEKVNVSEEMDEETGIADVQPEVETSEAEKHQNDAMYGAFSKVAGDDLEIDAYELQDILNAAFMKAGEFKFDGFTADTARSLVAMMDEDQSGKLGFPEFKKLWNDLRLWKAAFKKHDTDRSGNFNSYELRQAFHSIGLRVSNSTFNSLVLRYSHRDGKIYFDDYIHCVARMKTMFDVYKQQSNGRKAEFSLDEFIQTTMYS